MDEATYLRGRLAELEIEKRDLKSAIAVQKRELLSYRTGSCWCPVGIGLSSEHTEDCLRTQELLEESA